MAIQLNDAAIARLISERKPLPPDYRDRIRVKPKRGHSERELDVTGMDSSEFRLILRQSEFNHLDFSVILAYRPPKINQLFRLRRYNGKSHEHTNTLEGDTFYDFHIHMATERYQADSGLREDSFAHPRTDLRTFTVQFDACYPTADLTFPASLKVSCSKRRNKCL